MKVVREFYNVTVKHFAIVNRNLKSNNGIRLTSMLFQFFDPLCIWTKALTNTPYIQNRQSSSMKVLLGPKHKIWKGPFLDICTQLYSTFWMCFVHRYNYSWVDLTLPQICRFQVICKYLQVLFSRYTHDFNGEDFWNEIGSYLKITKTK